MNQCVVLFQLVKSALVALTGHMALENVPRSQQLLAYTWLTHGLHMAYPHVWKWPH